MSGGWRLNCTHVDHRTKRWKWTTIKKAVSVSRDQLLMRIRFRGSSKLGSYAALCRRDASLTHTFTHTPPQLMGRRTQPAGVWLSHTHTHTHLIPPSPPPRSICHPSKSYSSNFLFTAVEPLQWSLHQPLVFVPRLNSLSLGSQRDTQSSWTRFLRRQKK